MNRLIFSNKVFSLNQMGFNTRFRSKKSILPEFKFSRYKNEFQSNLFYFTKMIHPTNHWICKPLICVLHTPLSIQFTFHQLADTIVNSKYDTYHALVTHKKMNSHKQICTLTRNKHNRACTKTPPDPLLIKSPLHRYDAGACVCVT